MPNSDDQKSIVRINLYLVTLLTYKNHHVTTCYILIGKSNQIRDNFYYKFLSRKEIDSFLKNFAEQHWVN